MERVGLMDKKRIFITGASSQLMQKFISLTDKERYKIIGLTRDKTNKCDSIKWIEGDLRNINELSEYLRGCYMIVHAGAVTHSLDKKNYFEINMEASKQLVSIAKQSEIKRFIFISSRTAGAGHKSGAYGLSKLLAEQYIMKHLNDWIIFRPAELFGANKNEGIVKLINNVIEKRIIFCPNNIPSKLYPIHIDDTAKIIHDLTFNQTSERKVITINGNKGFSYHELIKLIDFITGEKTRIVPIPKFVMFIAKRILELTRINIGIVSDQIPRLYSSKQHQELDYNLLGLESYLRARMKTEYLFKTKWF